MLSMAIRNDYRENMRDWQIWICAVCLTLWPCLLPAQVSAREDLIVKALEMRRTVYDLVLDNDGFLWLGTNEGVFRFDGYDIDLAGGEALPHLNVPAAQVSKMKEDVNGNIWIGIQADVIVLKANREQALHLPSPLNSDLINRDITAMTEVDDEFWVVDLSQDIVCFEPVTDTTQELRIRRRISLDGNALRYLVKLEDGNVLVGTVNSNYFIVTPSGEVLEHNIAPVEYPLFFMDSISQHTYAIAETDVFEVDPYLNTFTPAISLAKYMDRRSPSWFVSARYADETGIWIGNRRGNLMWYSPSEGRCTDFTPILANRIYAGRYFSSNAAIPDNNNGLCIGTNQGLIHVSIPAKQHFQILPIPAATNSSNNFSVRGLFRARDGSLFMGSYSGLFRYLKDGSIREYKVWNAEARRHVNPLAYDFLDNDNGIWIASEGNGLLYYDFQVDSLKNIYPGPGHIVSEENKNCIWQFRIMKDHQDVIWIGTSNGLYTLNDSGTMVGFRNDQDLPPPVKVFDIREDDTGTLWVGTATGLYSISNDRKHIRKHGLGNSVSVVSSIEVMQDGNIMLGLRGAGLCIYDPSRGVVATYTTDQGLSNDVVCAIQSVVKDVYWVATNRGLSRFDLSKQQFRNYYLEDGLPDNEFNHGSWMTDRDGSLYFGGVGGVVRVNPGLGESDEPSPMLRVSKIAYHDGKRGTTRYMNIINDRHPEIRLGSRDKYFTVYYSTNQCVFNPGQTFAYMLEGLHNDWQNNGSKNFIQFTGLGPGTYTLKIRLLEESLNKEESMLSIPIQIARPLYAQWWAYVLYLLAIAGISSLILREYFKRQHIQRRLQLESEHRQKLEEINKSKSTFFTNITHEFKTPLTLIQGPAEEIGRMSDDAHISRYANLIAKNARSMLSMVNQLLALGKLEANLEEPHFYRRDLVRQVKAWMGNFDALAKQKQIELKFHAEEQAIYMDYDPVKVETMVNNLLSNAIKFTPEHGHVTCTLGLHKASAEQDQVSIAVQDDGPGIDAAEQEYIFERFYQGKSSQLGGTGIGLAFVREMVRVHHGTIQLHSEPGHGTRFTILLPVFQDKVDEKQSAAALGLDTADTVPGVTVFTSSPQEEAPVLLIAEDNVDVAQLIRDAFATDFKVIITSNGRDAHRRALEVIPDLVITDVMMPVMDGLSLTHQLKTDIHTSHIPVIMLTAKDSIASRIEGRSHGADVYLNKPFSVSELKLTVRNLLYLRQQVLKSVSRQITEDAGAILFANAQDASFYQSFLHVLEENISEPGLSIHDFVRELGISRTQLHRKLKGITGHSANQIIRNMRLQKGLALLKHSGKTVAEVAYEVGFSSPSYFTERFGEYYGYPPSEVLSQPQE